MKISELIKEKEQTLSFEVFPPKTSDSFESVLGATTAISSLKPDFMSVTYGAGGGTSKFTVALASEIKKSGVPALAHLTCISSTRETVLNMLDSLKSNGIENIMALRGDIPAGGIHSANPDYRYAYQLINEIKKAGDFCVGAACYPEGHPEAVSPEADIFHLKEKVECGADFLTTQMFFDNGIFLRFVERCRRNGINVPILAGIMPLTNAKQVKRTVELSGNKLPEKYVKATERFGESPEAMKRIGIIFAAEQIAELAANGVKRIHLYTMNKPDVASAIMSLVSEL